AIPQIDPLNREKHKAEREAVEKEYKEQEIHYYDKNGRVYDLQKFEENHFVALNPNEKTAESFVNKDIERGN
ncbi:MAG: ABC transporter ATP-binding protein, partial [Tetragenococcus halophilus]|nr:ABC transporter ATP-binding protein [Tetragenococcus halophilus]